MASCTAAFQESIVGVGETIHADFTWQDATKHPTLLIYATMSIISPSGTYVQTFLEFINSSGSQTLSYVTDEIGTWTAEIKVWSVAYWVTCTDTVYASLGTSCTAEFQESSATIGDTIHADFTWNNATQHPTLLIYATMSIINPSGTYMQTFLEFINSSSSQTLSHVTDMVGIWTAEIKVWSVAYWVTCTDTVSVSSGPGNGELTYFDIVPNPVPVGDSTTVYATGRNTGGAGYFCIGIWSEQHGTDWSAWEWINQGDYFSYNRTLSNVQYEQNCQAIIWWWDGSQPQNVDEEWLIIYVTGNVDMHIRPQSIFHTGPFDPGEWKQIAYVEFENLGNVPDDAILAWYDMTNVPVGCSLNTNQTDCEDAGCWWYDGSCHTPDGVILGSAYITNIWPNNVYSYDIYNNTASCIQAPNGVWMIGIKLYGTQEAEPEFTLGLGKTTTFKIQKRIQRG